MIRYGFSPEPDDTPESNIVLWRTSDGEPFTHIAIILDWAAFEKFMHDQRADW